MRHVLVFVLAGAAVFAAAPALARTNAVDHKPQKKTVQVYDNYYGPKKLTVNPKSRITWNWNEESADVHDVKLISAPKGVKKFQTEPASAGYKFSKTLTQPGTYKFICTMHEEDGMRMTIVVRH
jgi:plastocyanin